MFLRSVSKWRNEFSNEVALFPHRRWRRHTHQRDAPSRLPRAHPGSHASVSSAREASFEQIATVSLWQSKVHTEDVSELLRTVKNR